MAVYV